MINNNFSLYAVVVSTFLSLSSFEEGPVCEMGTTRSVFGGGNFFMGAVTVKSPSDDNDDVTLSGLMSPNVQPT